MWSVMCEADLCLRGQEECDKYDSEFWFQVCEYLVEQSFKKEEIQRLKTMEYKARAAGVGVAAGGEGQRGSNKDTKAET